MSQVLQRYKVPDIQVPDVRPKHKSLDPWSLVPFPACPRDSPQAHRAAAEEVAVATQAAQVDQNVAADDLPRSVTAPVAYPVASLADVRAINAAL